MKSGSDLDRRLGEVMRMGVIAWVDPAAARCTVRLPVEGDAGSGDETKEVTMTG